MQLSDNHIFHTLSSDIAEITKPLECLGIAYFSYSRSYHDGSRIYLQSKSEVLDIYLKGKHYLTGSTECNPDNYKEQTMHWSAMPNQRAIIECARPVGLDHGICLIQPQDNYLEIFNYAAKYENASIINTYLPRMDILKKFTSYFKDKAAKIIKLADKEKIVLPFNNCPDVTTALSNRDFDYDLFLYNAGLKNILTPRQMDCCVLLLKGKTSKEIAAKLNLSIRTVEYYIGNIKIKLNCRNKSELIAKLATMLH